MDKRKRKWYEAITDFAAWLITKHDELQIKFDKWLRAKGVKVVGFLKKILDIVETAAARLVVWHDVTQQKMDKRILLIRYKIVSRYHKNQRYLASIKYKLARAVGIGILVAIACVAVYSYNVGYAYAYNGKILGYVKNQEDVIKILDMASEELTKEYGADITIDTDTDIQFTRQIIIDKELDNADTVLKRLTYMPDMQAKSYGIYIDGKQFGICSTKEDAEKVLSEIKNQFTPKSEKREYEKVYFKEKIEIKEVNAKLANIGSAEKIKQKILAGGQKEESYTVRNGDTYYDICTKFDVTFDELKINNPNIKENSLYPGDKLVLTSAVPALTVVTVEKSTFAEVVQYKTIYKKSSSMYEGDSEVSQEGSNGKQVVTARITKENGKQVDRKDLEKKSITKSVTRVILKGTKERPKTAPTGAFSIPVSGYTLSSEFGWRWGRMHTGLDLACGTGTPIRAADGGQVVRAGWYSGYGLCIDINHENGYVTRYGHCSSVDVSVGQRVYKGEYIGAVGNTGNSYGSHCHFEIIYNGSPVDPAPYVY